MAVDFAKQMKRDFTILAPDIFPTHMELLQEVFALHGYHVEVLHDEGPAAVSYTHLDVYKRQSLDRLRIHRLHDLHRRRLLRMGQGHGRLLLQPDRC